MTTEEIKKLEATLWQTADTLRANSDLKSSEYSTPILGLIFLKFADNKYSLAEQGILEEYHKLKDTRREKPIEAIAVEKCGFYLPPEARYDHLLHLPENHDIAQAIKNAMQLIEQYKPELKDTLPQDEYFRLNRKQEGNDANIDNTTIIRLIKNFADIPKNATGDMFGQIYEYFLGKFAMAEGQGGGEFFTPRSVVRLMVQIIEPYQGTVFDPACGSGGMFVQSAQFIQERSVNGSNKKDSSNNNAEDDYNLFVYGAEKTLETVKLAKMNIAVNGLRGEIKQANSYYEDIHQSFGKFDYVLANPPFNVDDVNLESVEADRRFNTYGIPRNKTKAKAQSKGETKDKAIVTVPNANYLWINLFATSLKEKGRAGLVMANSASDARHSEADIRQKLIENNLIYAMITLPSNMFYTVTLPATLWFFDKAKQNNKILFIDARNIFTQIDRAHREFSEEQIQNIAVISRLNKGNRQAFVELVHSYFEDGFKRLTEHRPKLEEVANKVIAFLKENNGEDTPDFSPVLKDADNLLKKYADYSSLINLTDIDNANISQHKMEEIIAPFFSLLHEVLKEVDKKVRHIEKEQSRNKDLKTLKLELDKLHNEAKATEYFFQHIAWLHERFPDAKYEDVTGLCKLAAPDEVKEQDYSLNSGRYVGVVIEEDGKSYEEFISEMLSLNEEFENLNKEAHELEMIIGKNIRLIAGE